jgi:hypothetical protein
MFDHRNFLALFADFLRLDLREIGQELRKIEARGRFATGLDEVLGYHSEASHEVTPEE